MTIMANGAINSNAVEPSEGLPALESVEGLSESLFEILWRRRWIVLAATVLALAGGFLYLQRTTPQYTSTSRIHVEQTGPQVFERDNSGVITRWDNYLYTQAERIKSTDILSAALKAPGMAHLQTLADVSNPVVALRSQLTVTVGKNNNIISVSFLSPYPEEAAQVVNAVVDAYITAHDQRKRSTLGEVVRILKEEKAKRNQELMDKLAKMMKFKQDNESLAFGTDQDQNVILRRLERLSAVLTEAQLASVESKSFYEAALKMAGEPHGLRQLVEAQRARAVYFSSTNEASALEAELNRLERDKADALAKLKPDHPAIASLEADIQRAQKQLNELDARFARSELAAAEQQYLAAKEKEQELQKYFEEQRQQAILLNKQLTEYTLLESDYQQTTKLCDLLDDSIQRLDVSTEVGALNVSILEAARPAESPSEPQKAKVMGLALFLGLFAGVGLALVREWKDQRLRSTQEISTLLSLPVLGSVPSMRGSKETPSVRGQKVRTDPESRDAEAFRTVRTAIFFGAPKEEAKTLLVTSPAPGEGKSTIVANLGIAMAQAGQKVLVLDADFRRPMQHKIFNLDRKARGLSMVLAGEMTLEDAMEHSDLENLDILTCGPDVSNPAEMLNSDSFARMVQKLSAEYDRVLIDSPPVIAVSDSLILAALCDVTILILRAESSTRRVSMQAREALAGVDARVLGVVVNGVSHRSSRYGYYSGYGYYYYHYGEDGNGRRKVRKGRTSETAPALAAPARIARLNNGAEAGDDSLGQ